MIQMRIYPPGGSEDGRNTLLVQQLEPSPGLPYVSLGIVWVSIIWLTPSQNRTVLLGQARSEPILRSYLLAQFGVAVELATELVHFDQDEDGVSCHIVKHSVDGYKVEENIRVEYVVGADGARGRRNDWIY
jgi:hypothetical protein